MKKVLLASTALVGAVALLAGPAAAEVKVSAFSVGIWSGLDEDTATLAGTQEHDFSMNTEINFSSSMELDNGLTFGFQVQLEADTGSTGIDENDIFVSGPFGKVVFGNQDGAGDALMVNGSYVGIGYGGIGNPTGTGMTAVSKGAARTSVDLADSSDAIKLTYYTPRFNGFQAGVSYAPDLDSAGNDWDGGTGDPAGTGLGLEDFVELGLNYSGEFNGVAIDAGLAGIFADSPTGADVDGVGGGLQISYQGFTVAAGYVTNNEDGVGGFEEDVFDAGIGYSTGPWTVAIGGVWSDEDTSGDEYEYYSATVKYVVGAGLSTFGTVGGGTAQVGGVDNDHTVFTLGILTSF